MTGFCAVEEKLNGPFHKKEAPGTELPLSTKVWLEQRVAPAAERVGVGCTVSTGVEAVAVQPFTPVTVTLYTPECVGSTLFITGKESVEVKAMGPVHWLSAP